MFPFVFYVWTGEILNRGIVEKNLFSTNIMKQLEDISTFIIQKQYCMYDV